MERGRRILRDWDFTEHYLLTGILLFMCLVIVVFLMLLVFSVQDSYSGPSDSDFFSWYLEVVKGDSVKNFHQDLSMNLQPGSSAALAAYVLDKFGQMGYEIRSETRNVLKYVPGTADQQEVSVLDGSGNVIYRASAVQMLSGGTNRTGYFAYAGNGAATGNLVYLNDGSEAAYDLATSYGVNLRGAVIMMKLDMPNGRTPASLVQVAAERGAAAVILFADSTDVGFGQGNTYPDGPWQPMNTIPSGSLWAGIGDPSTPRWPSGLDSTGRADVMSNRTTWPGELRLPTIPVRPISAEAAQFMLGKLADTNCPKSFSGVLVPQYCMGPGPSVRVKSRGSYSYQPITNVFARVGGNIDPDRVIVVGAPRDAWYYGATETASSTAMLLEMARGLSEIIQEGFNPSRTILFASWDGSQMGQVGSLEWIEDNLPWLRRQQVVYLNVGAGVSGTEQFVVQTHPTLYPILNQLMEKVLIGGDSAKMLSKYFSGFRPVGSDSSAFPFTQSLSVASVDMSFQSPSSIAVRGTSFDTIDWSQRFGDTDYSCHEALTKYWGLVAMHLSVRLVLPMDFNTMATVLAQEVNYVSVSLTALGNSAQFSPYLQKLRASLASLQVTHSSFFAYVQNLLVEMTGNPTTDINSEYVERSLFASGYVLELRDLNDRVMLSTMACSDQSGLYGAPSSGFHLLFGSLPQDSTTSYSFPTLRSAITRKSIPDVLQSLVRVIHCIDTANSVINGTVINFAN